MKRLYSELIRPRTASGWTLMEGAYWVLVSVCFGVLMAYKPIG